MPKLRYIFGRNTQARIALSDGVTNARAPKKPRRLETHTLCAPGNGVMCWRRDLVRNDLTTAKKDTQAASWFAGPPSDDGRNERHTHTISLLLTNVKIKTRSTAPTTPSVWTRRSQQSGWRLWHWMWRRSKVFSYGAKVALTDTTLTHS